MNYKYEKGRFCAQTYGDCKRIELLGPFQMRIDVDFDDVDHDVVQDEVTALVDLLASSWTVF